MIKTRSKCGVVIKSPSGLIPAVGINQTQGGYFLNYYLNREHELFGTRPHDSRHETLIVSRQAKTQDLFSASVNVTSIDNRQTPEMLPSAGITRDLFLKPMSTIELAEIIDRPLVVPEEMCPQGIIVRVMIWPKGLNPSQEEMEKKFNTPPHFEPLIKTFVPDCFTNRVIVGVFPTDKNQRSFDFFIDKPLQSSDRGETYSNPISFHGGNNRE